MSAVWWLGFGSGCGATALFVAALDWWHARPPRRTIRVVSTAEAESLLTHAREQHT